MKEIRLSQNKVAWVDDGDFEVLSKFKWYAMKHRQTYYAVYTDYSTGKKITVRMHRFLMNALPGETVDHRNGKGLDNQKQNIRFCTFQQNAQNRRLESKGVSKARVRKNGIVRWVARITIKGKTRTIGRFLSKSEAISAYQNESSKMFGEFAPNEF